MHAQDPGVQSLKASNDSATSKVSTQVLNILTILHSQFTTILILWSLSSHHYQQWPLLHLFPQQIMMSLVRYRKLPLKTVELIWRPHFFQLYFIHATYNMLAVRMEDPADFTFMCFHICDVLDKSIWGIHSTTCLCNMYWTSPYKEFTQPLAHVNTSSVGIYM